MSKKHNSKRAKIELLYWTLRGEAHEFNSLLAIFAFGCKWRELEDGIGIPAVSFTKWVHHIYVIYDWSDSGFEPATSVKLTLTTVIEWYLTQPSVIVQFDLLTPLRSAWNKMNKGIFIHTWRYLIYLHFFSCPKMRFGSKNVSAFCWIIVSLYAPQY